VTAIPRQGHSLHGLASHGVVPEKPTFAQDGHRGTCCDVTENQEELLSRHTIAVNQGVMEHGLGYGGAAATARLALMSEADAAEACRQRGPSSSCFRHMVELGRRVAALCLAEGPVADRWGCSPLDDFAARARHACHVSGTCRSWSVWWEEFRCPLISQDFLDLQNNSGATAQFRLLTTITFCS